MKKRWLIALALAVSSALLAAPARSQTEIIGSYYKTPEQKAMECYGRGVKAKRKADGEKDPAKQAKLYLKAKEELSKSVGIQANYDGYLALGQVYLALGNPDSAFDACSHAQGLKPKDETAKACAEEAWKKVQEAAREKTDGQDGNGG
jgi:cytochrome c-type biogenesis protein CcmH/NrfG